jgi:hypothetical protein
MNCETCSNYGFYKMITGRAYWYAGPIPCLNCSRFSWVEDNYKPTHKDSISDQLKEEKV